MILAGYRFRSHNSFNYKQTNSPKKAQRKSKIPWQPWTKRERGRICLVSCKRRGHLATTQTAARGAKDALRFEQAETRQNLLHFLGESSVF
jgi:hypothetical protein